MFRLLDCSFDDPAMNLALDEALLESVEAGRSPDTLRFWECPTRFAVIGTAQSLHDEVHADACARDDVPVLRRCTAGGCVLQGPGSLNFAFALALERHPEARSLHGSYRYLLDRIAAALTQQGCPARFEGVCDLAVNGRKVSGNAQRRKRNSILHHGTLLYAPDVDAMSRYLREPRDRPAYRGDLPHRDFVGALLLSPAALRTAVRGAFGVPETAEGPTALELEAGTHLAESKYRDPAWTHRR